MHPTQVTVDITHLPANPTNAGLGLWLRPRIPSIVVVIIVVSRAGQLPDSIISVINNPVQATILEVALLGIAIEYSLDTPSGILRAFLGTSVVVEDVGNRSVGVASIVSVLADSPCAAIGSGVLLLGGGAGSDGLWSRGRSELTNCVVLRVDGPD